MELFGDVPPPRHFGSEPTGDPRRSQPTGPLRERLPDAPPPLREGARRDARTLVHPDDDEPIVDGDEKDPSTSVEMEPPHAPYFSDLFDENTRVGTEGSRPEILQIDLQPLTKSPRKLRSFG